jgi:serine protease Do
MDDARRVIAELMSVEQLGGATHGLVLQDVKSAEEQKVVVAGARSDGPARQAGFRQGDEIVKVGPVAVEDAVDVERSLLGHRPGEPIEVVVRRDDHLETLTLHLGHHRGAPATAGVDTVVRANNDESSNDRAWNVLGLRLAQLPPGDQSLAGSRYHGGMRVLDVRSGSPAALNGIRAGDVLVGLHSWETTKPEDVIWVITHKQIATFSPLKFYIIRGRETLYGHLQIQMASR